MDDLRKLEDAAILRVLELQQQVGVDVFTDGEFRRGGWSGDFVEAVDGYAPGAPAVVLGLVTSKSGELETQDTLLRRIDEAAKYVALNNLALSPQCGFASTLAGNPLTEDEERRKLELVVETARRCGARFRSARRHCAAGGQRRSRRGHGDRTSN